MDTRESRDFDHFNIIGKLCSPVIIYDDEQRDVLTLHRDIRV
jgi:hypothetical protein